MTSNDFVLILFHIFIQGRKSLGQKIPSAKKAQIGQSLRLENHITLCYWLIKVMLLLKCQNLKFLSKCMIWFYYFNFAILFFISFIILLGMLVSNETRTGIFKLENRLLPTPLRIFSCFIPNLQIWLKKLIDWIKLFLNASGARLRRIQELLKSEDTDNKPDAILCIAGKNSNIIIKQLHVWGGPCKMDFSTFTLSLIPCH